MVRCVGKISLSGKTVGEEEGLKRTCYFFFDSDVKGPVFSSIF